MSDPLALGTQTRWGKIAAIKWDGVERFYMMVDERGDVSLMPADVVEADHANLGALPMNKRHTIAEQHQASVIRQAKSPQGWLAVFWFCGKKKALWFKTRRDALAYIGDKKDKPLKFKRSEEPIGGADDGVPKG